MYNGKTPYKLELDGASNLTDERTIRMAKSILALPSQEEIKSRLWYDPSSGIFRWRFAKRCGLKPWDTAGHPETKGYIQILVGKHYYMAHRLAWMYMTGAEPDNQVDHIDGDRKNNAWHNLRTVTNKQNCENRKLSVKNKTGARGVYVRGNKFVAEICHNYKRIKIGTFDTLEDAAVAAREKRLELFTHAEGKEYD